ncbi:hypothetical protein P3T18_001192 [Paraburkholderia sp. GAS199]|uniref:hypothetical protein n=1 Tax=Paraburkholderia sp. GAS199 TaxID=3035126 RepID=UPI003D1C258A
MTVPNGQTQRAVPATPQELTAIIFKLTDAMKAITEAQAYISLLPVSDDAVEALNKLEMAQQALGVIVPKL